MTIALRIRHAALAAFFLLTAWPAQAADKVAVGVLRYVSSGGLFLAQERGYFKDEGIDAELVFFDAAQPIAVAVASGDTPFGVTAITGGTLNLAGKGALKIVASQGAERKGYKGNALLVSNAAFARGITSLDKLPGTSIAITQVGSSHHYMLGQIAEAKHFDLDTLTLKPLQSISNMVAAVKGGQVDGALVPPQLAGPMIERGEAKLVANFADLADYQYGAVFASPKVVAGNPDLVQRFVRAYQKGNADYAKALLRTDDKGQPVVDAETRAAAEIVGKYVYPNDSSETAAKNILASVVFVDAKGIIDTADIDRQIAWYKKQKLVDARVESKSFVDTSFAH